MIAKFFIDRPVLANVIAILTVILGLVAMYGLPVSQYPNVVPPSIQVTTRYPGANAETIIRDVALPIEQKVNGVEGMLYMQSTAASDGSYALTVTFQIGTDPDQAQILVQNRVQSAIQSLPDAVQSQGVQTAKRSTSILAIVALSSDTKTHDSLFMANYATINLIDQISRIPGIGNVNVFGSGQYAVRIWMDPELMAARGLIPADVVNAINRQSRSTSAGQLGLPPVPAGQQFQYTLTLDSKLSNVPSFADIIVKASNSDGGQVTRLRDVARIELGAQQYNQDFTMNGRPAAGLALFTLPEANALDVMKRVNAQMQVLSKQFPAGMHYAVPFDTTRFVSAAVEDVYHTLFEAAILVLIVILVFLQDWRATLVPATTVPVTIIGAFAAMALFGFTINLSTLFAIILAIGIVVDDAIVVVEAASRHIEEGKSPREAAILAMDELLGPIIGITLVLLAVFLPAAFLPGLSGQMYKQFSLVIAATALISAINAMTLKPTQAALWLAAYDPNRRKNFFYRGFNAVYNLIERGYTAMIRGMVRISIVLTLLCLVLVGVSVYLLSRVPTSFLPVEDQGYFLVSVQLPEGASLERTRTALEATRKRVADMPVVENVIAISGLSALNNNASQANSGVLYIILRDWSVRAKGEDLLSLYNELNRRTANLPDGKAQVLPPPPIQGIGNAAGFALQIEAINGKFDYASLQKAAARVAAEAAKDPAIRQAFSPFRADAPQFAVSIDRTKAETMGVDLGSAYDTVSQYIGSAYAGQVNLFGRVFQVYVQAAPDRRIALADLQRIKLRSDSGAIVPLGTLADIKIVTGPSLISLYNLHPSAQIVGSQAQGFSTGQAMDALDRIVGKLSARDFIAEWTAASFQEKQLGNQIYLVYALSLLLVYFVLAGQYESWLAPLSVIATVPLALIGTAATLLAAKASVNLYTQIGLVLLIALSAKNAILIVEFARHLRHQGRPILEAAIEAARTRFRPILMTSIAFILGVVPLVLQTGAGASAQKSIGIAVLTGMIGSTCLTVVFVPSLFVVLQRIEEWFGRGKAAPAMASATPAELMPRDLAEPVAIRRTVAPVVAPQPAPEPIREAPVVATPEAAVAEKLPADITPPEPVPSAEPETVVPQQPVVPQPVPEANVVAAPETVVEPIPDQPTAPAGEDEDISLTEPAEPDVLEAWLESVAGQEEADNPVDETPFEPTTAKRRLKAPLRKHQLEAVLKKHGLDAVLKKQKLDALLSKTRLKAPLMNRPRVPPDDAMRKRRAETPSGPRRLKASRHLNRPKS
jgi:HAE1 family hydrophobic/amphiphilic exporter-1